MTKPPFLRTPLGDSPVVLENEFNASAERLFRAMTDPSDLKQWFGSMKHQLSEIEIDLRVGGKWRFAFPEEDGKQDTLHGEYLEVDPNQRLAYSWIYERKTVDGQTESSTPSQVTITFEETSSGTRMRLEHGSIESLDHRRGVGGGWSDSFTKLAALLASAHGVTFPDRQPGPTGGYNYTENVFGEEMPGISTFTKLDDGRVAHTYSTYGPGLDMVNAAFSLLDLTPLGRQEEEGIMNWVRRHDEYER